MWCDNTAVTTRPCFQAKQLLGIALSLYSTWLLHVDIDPLTFFDFFLVALVLTQSYIKLSRAQLFYFLSSATQSVPVLFTAQGKRKKAFKLILSYSKNRILGVNILVLLSLQSKCSLLICTIYTGLLLYNIQEIKYYDTFSKEHVFFFLYQSSQHEWRQLCFSLLSEFST